MFRRLCVPVLVASLALPVWGGKEKKLHPTLVKRDPVTVQIPDLQVPSPKQRCPNWAWAAAVELMLSRQNVDIKQTDWILKANGGELCIETPVDINTVKKAIEGDYVLMTGEKIHIAGVVTPGPPQDVGYLIASVRDGHPLLVLWKGRPVVLQSVEYDEYIYPNNQRMFEARKMIFIDPLGDKPITYDKATDPLTDVGDVLDVRVGPVEHFR